MRAVAGWLPYAVPRVLGEDAKAGWFAMDYLAPEDHPLWKARLLAGIVDVDFAAAVGRDLAIIHARSAADPNIPSRSPTTTFEAIRIEPYLRDRPRTPQAASRFDVLAADDANDKRALVHGDISPKNILQGPGGPVFLDAECAWFGDPAFDLAFCLNHLLLRARARAPTGAHHRRFFGAGRRLSGWRRLGERDGIEARAAALLPALFLARVDGKSPVEYLTRESERAAVRRCAIPHDRRSAASPEGRRRRLGADAMSVLPSDGIPASS